MYKIALFSPFNMANRDITDLQAARSLTDALREDDSAAPAADAADMDSNTPEADILSLEDALSLAWGVRF